LLLLEWNAGSGCKVQGARRSHTVKRNLESTTVEREGKGTRDERLWGSSERKEARELFPFAQGLENFVWVRRRPWVDSLRFVGTGAQGRNTQLHLQKIASGTERTTHRVLATTEPTAQKNQQQRTTAVAGVFQGLQKIRELCSYRFCRLNPLDRKALPLGLATTTSSTGDAATPCDGRAT
jgi:hypothetical protein